METILWLLKCYSICEDQLVYTGLLRFFKFSALNTCFPKLVMKPANQNLTFVQDELNLI